MVELRNARRRMLRRATRTIAVLAALAGTMSVPDPAAARHHHHRGRMPVAHRPAGHVVLARVRPGSYTPPFSMYAVDGNSGHVLYARDENALRHPASITKVMTLYLLFEQLDRHRLSLDSRISVSQHAAAQAPTKLGLRPGSTIRVEDAVKAIVTKSANDMAVAIAEAIGGDEPNFARMMTRKAHTLGMSRTNFVNASGLPDDMQLTTAHDLAQLGRAIHDRFPQYFHFFSTPSFRYAGQFMPNHNHLMEQVEGMDGIKTGYTRSSGFNLLSSVNRHGHWLVSVVLGGKTRLGRDRIMADLIASEIDKCATMRTTPLVAENPALEHVAEAIPVVQHVGEDAPPVQEADDDTAEARPASVPKAVAVASADPVTASAPQETAEAVTEETPAPAPVAKLQPRVQVASIATEATTSPRPRPAFVPGNLRAGERDMIATGSIRPRESRFDGTTGHYSGADTATPVSARLVARRERAAAREAAKAVKVASLEPVAVPSGRPAAVGKGGWMVQIGATPTLDKANELLAKAKAHAGTGRAFTEKVQKGKETLFRARFAGLDAGGAESACKSLKKAGFSCFATRN